MNIEKLKADFYNYLKDIKKSEQKDGDEKDNSGDASLEDISEFSIFNNLKDFKEYLQDELNLSSEALYMSINDIENLEIENGKLVDKEAEKNGKQQEDISMFDIFNLLVQDDGFKAEYDSDGNGEIERDEFDTFQNSVKGLDGNEEDISLDDIIEKTLERNENTEENTEEEKASEEKEIPETEANTSETEEVPKADTSSANNTYNPSSAGGGGGYTPYASSSYNISNNTTPSYSNSENKSVEELQADLAKADSDLAEKQTALTAVQNGSDSVVAPLKQEMETALKDYLDALNEEDTPEAEELAEVTKKIEDNETVKREQEEQKQNLNDTIETENNNIETYQGVMDDCDSMISDLNSHIGRLESEKSNPENAENAGEIQKQIDAANAEIKTLNDKKDKAEQNRTEAESRKDAAKQKLEKMEEAILLTDEELTELESRRDELEAVVLEENPKLAQMKEAYETAKDTYISTREKAVTEAKSEIEKAQDEVGKLSNQLVKAKEKEDDTKYAVNKSSLPAELVKKLDEKLGAGFCARLEEVAKSINCDPADLIGLMQSESGINPQAYNNAGGATGLIQFMPGTAKTLGTTTDALKNMSAVEQLDYVEKYFKQFSYVDGNRKITAGDLYTLCFLPAFINQEVLTTSSQGYYKYNSGLDSGKDGKITKSELSDRVRNKYQEVLRSV